jgi:tripartite-type tricarboxylate transporter receptor subunit TctC
VGEFIRLSLGLGLGLGLDLVHVPFNSAGLAINSTIGGHMPISIVAPAATVPQVQDGNGQLRRRDALGDFETYCE